MPVKPIVNADQPGQGLGVQIGERLRASRIAAGLSVDDAASKVGLRSYALRQAEDGRLPSVLKLREMLALYGVSSHFILTGQDLLEISPGQAAELRCLARTASSELQTKISLLTALFTRSEVELSAGQ